MKKFVPLIAIYFLLGIGSSGFAQLTQTETFPISSGADDVEQDLLGGIMDLSSSDIELTQDGASDQIIGLRFTGITIPAGAEINEAYIQVTADEVNTTGEVNVLIATEDTAVPQAYTSAPNELLARADNAFLGNLNIWNIAPFEAEGDDGLNQRTPNLSDLVSNSINHPDWEAGNAIAFLMVDPVHVEIPGYEGNAGVKRVFQTYDNEPANAARLVITYTIPDIYYTGTFPIEEGSSWLYNDLGLDLGSEDWTALDYEGDETWEWGDAKLGYGDGNEATTLDFGTDEDNKYPSYYLRHIFEVDDATQIDSLIFNVRRDDGAVVYVNGVEAFRMNMPEGEIGYNTLAEEAVAGSGESTFFEKRTGNLLQPGLNVIAVSLHQSSVSSSDLGFDMSVGFIATPPPAATFPMEEESVWNYLDTGVSLDEVEWTNLDYDDYSWMSGQGPLGYGDPVNTAVSFGPDPDNKFITTYFRRSIDIELENMPDTVLFGLLRDDGALVYINGEEIIRSNMPDGEITYLTHSSSIISGSAEANYNTFLLPKTVFEDGLNQIAVELHNRDESSSDARFDMYIKEMPEPPFVNPPADCSVPRIGCFTSVVPTEQTPFVVIPETHRFQLLFQQGDTYMTGGGIVPGNNDFTAYVGTDGSSELGTVFVNHETSPGGVSMVDIAFNDTTQLWEVTNTEPVDFSSGNLVGTNRNCSGGITPWGTVITSEETYNTADQNEDGIIDMGWHVEIDPETRAIVDYDGDGAADKLWKMGRMQHENVVVADDSITAYYGEDGGTQCVYKYIADEPGKLNSGTLYVLSLENALSGGEPVNSVGAWVEVPNATQADMNNTRSIAGALGGTNFNGVEDVEISPIDGMIYFTSKGNGRIYRFMDDGETISGFETFVGGQSYPIVTNEGVVIESWGGGNDNLTFDDQGNLWVLQDGSRSHLWIVRPDHSQLFPKVELFMTTPIGSEPCGLTFSPDYRFGFVSIQHPSGSNGAQTDVTGSEVAFNLSATIVFALKENLGPQAPMAEFTADNTTIIQGETVTFNDESEFFPTSWEWSFEGGTPSTSTEQNPQVTYSEVGSFEVSLTATNAQGSNQVIETGYINVAYPAPVVDFEASTTEIFAGEPVTFTDMSNNEPTSWLWTFEGGTPSTSTEQNPTVVFDEVGSFDVTLVSGNATGDGEANVKIDFINAIIPLPVADFEASETLIAPGAEVSFTDLSENQPSNWLWVFDGGIPSTSTQQNPVVSYNEPGTYDVALISTNESGTGPVNLKVEYITVDQSLSVNENSFESDLNLFPNPTNGEISIELNLKRSGNIAIELFDVAGKKLADLERSQVVSGNQVFTYNLATYLNSSQIAVIKITTNNQTTSRLVYFTK